jgi:hypothetical protein
MDDDRIAKLFPPLQKIRIKRQPALRRARSPEILQATNLNATRRYTDSLGPRSDLGLKLPPTDRLAH